MIRQTAYATDDADRDKIAEIAERLGLNVEYGIQREVKENDSQPILTIDESGLSLIHRELSLRGDFMKLKNRVSNDNLNREPLVRAAKIKDFGEKPTVFDGTAGLGEDSFLLAAAGFEVYLFEHNPKIAALLRDALYRGADNPEISGIVRRMHFSFADSVIAMPEFSTRPDIVFLDPMFPARQKSSLVKKKLQLFQSLESPCNDEYSLFSAAKKANPYKVIVKRPAKSAYFADITPAYSIGDGGIRFDCYVFNAKQE